ncbi:hypothetical protein ACHAQA_001567 [Verticillium albo-atrum]
MAQLKNDQPIAEATEHVDVSTKVDAPNPVKDLSDLAAAEGQGLSGYESLTVLQTIMKFQYLSLMCVLASLSAAAEGYQISLVGNIIANPGFAQQFGTERNENGDMALASSVISLWGAMASLGQLVGQVAISFISNRFGRKIAMYSLWIIIASCVITESLARNWKVWLLAKILGGLGVGCLQACIPIYVGEIAPVRARGFFLMCYSFWWISGQFFAPLAMQFMSDSAPNDWLTLVYTQWGHVGLMLIIFIVIPESPSWCILRGKMELAKKNLRTMYWRVHDIDIDYQYNLLASNIAHERDVSRHQKSENFLDLFRGSDRIRTIISFWTIMTQQFIGLQVFFGYGTYFFQQAGVKNPFTVTCITSGINIATSIVIMVLADFSGRRWMAISGTSLCWICNICVGILGIVSRTNASDALLVVFAVFWNIGLILNNASGYAYLGETSSQRLRAFTGGFATGIIGPVGITMQVLVPYMINANQWNWGLKTTWFFAGTGLPFLVAMFFLLPETNSTAELDELFERKIKPWRFSKTETLTQRVVHGKKQATEKE